MPQAAWFVIEGIEHLDSPALVVYPDRVRANIRAAIAMTGDVNRLRPHIKTCKSPGAVKLLQEAGIRKFKCATIAEAEMLGICGAEDVLLAYQPLGPKLQRFIHLIKKYPGTGYSCLTDRLDAAEEMSANFSAAGLTVPVFMDLNTGMNRTGIQPGGDAIVLYRFLSSAPGLYAAGLHAYDGHCRNPDFGVRTRECDQAFALVEELRDQLEKNHLIVPVIIAGGSPTFPIHARRLGIECSPGTFIYWDKGYSDICPEQPFLPAAVLVTRVVSCPAPDRVCTDMGHKSVAAENEIGKRISFLHAGDLLPVSQSEEHLVLQVKPGHSYLPGQVLYGLPYHICPTVALYERVFTIENGRVSGEWENSARNRFITV